MQDARNKFQAYGLGLAAISYDSEAILMDFSLRKRIEYPLLSDRESRIISDYGALNPKATGMARGVPYPGYVFVGPDGTVREEYFEASYADRITANNLFSHLFPELTEEARRNVPAPHVKIALVQSDRDAVPGSIVRLTVQMSLPPGIHVYAPEVSGYKPTRLEMKLPAELVALKTGYPASKTLLLPAIKEKAPVFEGKFPITQDVLVSSDREFLMTLGSGRMLRVAGSLQYQACSNTTCFLPTQIPISWDLKVSPLDYERSPQSIRRK